jgi:alpha-beta hydrolase superfamily lysophospholipase
LLVALASVLGLYALVCVAARASYRRFVYPAPQLFHLPLSGGEPLALRAADGAGVSAFWLAPPPGARLVVYFHGNGETIGDAVPLAHDLAAHGLGALLVEYRGYGASAGGTPSEAGLYLDAEAALDEAARRGIGSDRIALWGFSLGTGVAAEMARRGRGARLVLVSPFTSLTDVASRAVGWLPMSVVVPDRYDTLSKATSIHVPTLIVHGDGDDVVPFDMGRSLASAIAGARFVPIPGAAHGDVYVRGGTELVSAIAAHCAL